MNLQKHVQLMARYNAEMNDKIYATASQLSEEQLSRDRRAFFHSILGTLNHLVVSDTIWLKRFSKHSISYPSLDEIQSVVKPERLDQIIYSNFEELRAARKRLDKVILAFAQEITESDLDQILEYRNMKGIAARKTFGSVLTHFFNHQTHHRGQTTTLLFQEGLDVGITDVLAWIPDVTEESRT